MNRESSISKIVPVMLAFFVMGFVDLVGIATNYVKQDFSLSDTAANAFSVMLFLWFLVLSVPTGMLMNKIGRKKTVLLSMVVTLLGLVCPFIHYGKAAMFIAFALLGIGNTFMQVSLNPLVANMVAPEKQPSFLTLGQFVKAIASFLAPIIAVQAALKFNDWRLLFGIFAFIDLVALIYLYATDVKESDEKKEVSSFLDCIKMLGQGTILFLFIGILMHVGLDVGVNITAPKLLQERTGMTLAQAGYATSVYFLMRTLGSFLGTFIMSRFSPVKTFLVSTLMILVGVVGLFFFNGAAGIYVCVALIGLGNSNVFSIIFSNALRYMPEKNNEISGLMIMGISGGAVIPVIMGAASDALASQIGSVIVLAVCVAYLLFLNVKLAD